MWTFNSGAMHIDILFQQPTLDTRLWKHTAEIFSHLGLNKYKPVLMMSDSSSLRPSGIGWLWGQIPSHWTQKNISFGPLLLLCPLLAWRLTARVSVGRVVHMLKQRVQTKCSLQIRYIYHYFMYEQVMKQQMTRSDYSDWKWNWKNR